LSGQPFCFCSVQHLVSDDRDFLQTVDAPGSAGSVVTVNFLQNGFNGNVEVQAGILRCQTHLLARPPDKMSPRWSYRSDAWDIAAAVQRCR
jgi:hypothetical protein